MERLDFIASLTKGSNIILDVGTDHAYTVINAIKNYGVSYAIASDINLSPLKSAQENINKAGLTDKVKLILSNGLKNINDDFDTLIISGIGGLKIKEIIENDIDKIRNKHLILSPHSDFYKLRLFLVNQGFIISNEYAIYDKDKYYEIIIFDKGLKEYTDFELKYGPILLKKMEDSYLKKKKSEYDSLKNIFSKINNIKEKIEVDKKIKELEVILYDRNKK